MKVVDGKGELNRIVDGNVELVIFFLSMQIFSLTSEILQRAKHVCMRVSVYVSRIPQCVSNDQVED